MLNAIVSTKEISMFDLKKSETVITSFCLLLANKLLQLQSP